MRQNYRIMVHDGRCYRPIAGIDCYGHPVFVRNRIHGLVFFDLPEHEAQVRFAHIRATYPELRFNFRPAE